MGFCWGAFAAFVPVLKAGLGASDALFGGLLRVSVAPCEVLAAIQARTSPRGKLPGLQPSRENELRALHPGLPAWARQTAGPSALRKSRRNSASWRLGVLARGFGAPDSTPVPPAKMPHSVALRVQSGTFLLAHGQCPRILGLLRRVHAPGSLAHQWKKSIAMSVEANSKGNLREVW